MFYAFKRFSIIRRRTVVTMRTVVSKRITMQRPYVPIGYSHGHRVLFSPGVAGGLFGVGREKHATLICHAHVISYTA